MLTNIGLVKHAKMALREKWCYTYSCYGQILTEEILQWIRDTYPKQVDKYIHYIRANNLGKRNSDCVGLFKSYLWWNNGNIKYNAQQDLSANGMFDKATVKGKISTIPKIQGLGVWRNGHVGIYVDGKVIEMKGTLYGCMQTPLLGEESNNWEYWFQYPFIEYVENDDTFKDIKGHYAEKYIEAIGKTGLMVGDGNGNFNPDGAITRGQMAVILAKLLHMPIEDKK